MKKFRSIFYLLLFYSSFAFSHGGGEVDLADIEFYLPIHIGLDGAVSYTIGAGSNDDHGGQDMAEEHLDLDILEMIGVMPIVYIGYDRFTHIINLGKDGDKDDNDHSMDYHQDNHGVQKNSDHHNYYKVAKAWGSGFGLGLGAGTAPGNVGTWGGELLVGIMPTVGGSVFTERMVSNKAAIQSLKRLKVPKSLEELSSWNKGDSMAYNVSGGVAFHGGFGVTIFTSATLVYAAQGSWNVSLKKVDDTRMMAVITKGKVSHFSANAGASVVGLSAGAFKNRDKNFSFLFDFKEEVAIGAFKQMLRGKLTTAQELSAQGHNGVRWIKRGTNTLRGKVFEFSGTLPFLAKGSRSWGEMQTVSKTFEVNKKEVTAHMTMVHDEMKTAGVVSAHKKRSFHFVGVHKSGTHKPNYAGTFKWVYQNDRLNGKKLKKEIEKLVKRVGLANELRVQIPEGKLGFVQASFDLHITQGGINNLLHNAPSLAMNKGFVSNRIDEVLRNKEDRSAFCKTQTFLNVCKKILKKRTMKALKKAQKHLSKMRTLLSAQKGKEFTKELARLGRQMMKNRFVFQTLLREVGAKGLKMELSLKGQNILPFEKKVYLLK